MTTDPDLTALVAADPAAGVDLDPVRASNLLRAAVDAEKAANARGGKRWRRRVAGVVAGVLVVGVGVPVGAYAGSYLTRTGEYGAPGATENDTSEWLDPLAPDFPDYAVNLWPDYIKLPPGYDVRTVARQLAEREAATDRENLRQDNEQAAAEGRDPAPGVIVQTTGVRGMFAMAAQCHWQHEWLTTNDAARKSNALTVLGQSERWPALVAIDGGGIVDGVKAYVDAATRGDAQPMAADYDTNCQGIFKVEAVR